MQGTSEARQYFNKQLKPKDAFRKPGPSKRDASQEHPASLFRTEHKHQSPSQSSKHLLGYTEPAIPSPSSYYFRNTLCTQGHTVLTVQTRLIVFSLPSSLHFEGIYKTASQPKDPINSSVSMEEKREENLSLHLTAQGQTLCYSLLCKDCQSQQMSSFLLSAPCRWRNLQQLPFLLPDSKSLKTDSSSNFTFALSIHSESSWERRQRNLLTRSTQTHTGTAATAANS